MTSWFLSWICELDATHIFYSCQQTEVQKKKNPHYHVNMYRKRF